MSNTLVAPSILSADFSRIEQETERISNAGADWIHCDVMDGHFVPNISFGFKMIADIKKCTKLPLDVHLMIEKPSRYLSRFIDAGADILTFHFEAEAEPEKALELIKKSGIKCGLVISPDTNVAVLEPYVSLCDTLMLMSVYPGFSAQAFITGSLERLKQLKTLRDKYNRNALVEIDGGVNVNNSADIIRAGADVLVAGNAVFSAVDAKEAISRIKSAQ